MRWEISPRATQFPALSTAVFRPFSSGTRYGVLTGIRLSIGRRAYARFIPGAYAHLLLLPERNHATTYPVYGHTQRNMAFFLAGEVANTDNAPSNIPIRILVCALRSLVSRFVPQMAVSKLHCVRLLQRRTDNIRNGCSVWRYAFPTRKSVSVKHWQETFCQVWWLTHQEAYFHSLSNDLVRAQTFVRLFGKRLPSRGQDGLRPLHQKE
ncbi:hypothetical protein EDD37DRAFT_299829 [Exophiala viscosa]|uniref:uncharacterized protein n=1 Tax=Exophiala viscosa TaxID=2486360 RepID=UPI002192E71A|nr:hypothetical protein EDD37DRAFT_299829 [Exophiala viscosa]